jgi:O-6-methylguanine DNA methyltransferase
MRCETVRRMADAFRTGETSRSAAERIRVHLRCCIACSRYMSFLGSLAAAGRGLRARAPKGLVQKVLAGTADHFAKIDTRLGPAWVGFNRRGFTLLRPGGMDSAEFGELYRRIRGRTATPAKLPPEYARIVRTAAEGKPMRAARVDMTGLTAFQRRILQLLQTIPRGEVRTYAWLAREAGKPRAARAVGNVMAGNPVPWILPCHRVVPSEGGVGNYAFGSDMKRNLLRLEGALA